MTDFGRKGGRDDGVAGEQGGEVEPATAAGDDRGVELGDQLGADLGCRNPAPTPSKTMHRFRYRAPAFA